MDQAIDEVAWKRAYAERCCQLTAATLIVWEHFLQFDHEISLFWKKRWSWGKVVFLWSRYYTIGFVVGNAIGASDFMLRLFGLIQTVDQPICNRFFRWQNTGAAVQVITTHIVLELRLYAMYRSVKPVVLLLVFLTVAESVVMGVLFGIPKGLGVSNPAPGVFICADSDLPGVPWVAFYYTCILCTESTLLVLSLYKAWAHRDMAMRHGLYRLITRDSVYYFALLFWVYLGNQIIWIYNIPTLNELGTGFAFALSAVFANRLMISLRTGYYGRSPAMGILDPGFDDHTGRTTGSVGISGDYELTTFNETAGF
ncbi:hypothetical protein DENSPDRAFT_932487 [Dentipellis sp. KUC8613]|nr:hypothetical protein DENSPDRAFT_932487 [Dentipellis sp. KUC8613]